jgi:hypothetical protein
MKRTLFIIKNMQISMDLPLMTESVLAKSTLITHGSSVNGKHYHCDSGLDEQIKVIQSSLLKPGSILAVESILVLDDSYVQFLNSCDFVDASELCLNPRKPELLNELIKRYSDMIQCKTELCEKNEKLKLDCKTSIANFCCMKESHCKRISCLQHKNFDCEPDQCCVNNSKLLDEENLLLCELNNFKSVSNFPNSWFFS